MTDNILVHNVRLEIGRQISAVYQSFSAFLYVFEKIADGLHDIVFVYRLEIVSAEVPQKCVFWYVVCIRCCLVL